MAAGAASAAGAGGEFVEGWLVAQVLGEGAYGEVRLLVHARTGAAVALKAVRGGAEGAAAGEAGAASREAALHGALRHAHVVRCLGARAHAGAHYLFLEYCAGGELFDRIEPDAGMPPARARRYWRQLAAGLRYLHARGVAHRDIKPENLLLDHRDHLKISDFGLATLFRHGARERLLARVCGTLPYCAPEVLRAARRPYRAPPADLWAAALVLLAMLAGELPWERASPEDARYAAWSARAAAGGGGGEPAEGPWRKLCAGARALLARALHPLAAHRAPLDELLCDPWLAPPAPAPRAHYGGARVWHSQPAAAAPAEGGAGGSADGGGGMSAADMAEALLSYSQPAHADELLLSTQLAGGAPLLVRRMTRVWLRCGEAEALRALCDALRERGYSWRHLQPRILAIECGPDVRMRAWTLRCDAAAVAGEPLVLLEFRRSRGCGLAFKRRFLELRAALAPLSAPPPAHAHAPLAPPPAHAPEPMDES